MTVKNTMQVPFTPELREWLAANGYTHILSDELSEHPEKSGEDDPFLVTPLKPGDVRFKVPENKHRIRRITSSDIVDMAEGLPLIRFVVIVPVKEFERYLKA
jgi:hypothetical protein